MFAYIDTSALLKWYVREAGSQFMRAAREKQEGWATSRLTYAEGLAAIHRRRREGALSKTDSVKIVARLEQDFSGLYVVDVNALILSSAKTWAQSQPLRGADLVHIATALWLRTEGILQQFFCSDTRLANAAEELGLKSVNPEAVAE